MDFWRESQATGNNGLVDTREKPSPEKKMVCEMVQKKKGEKRDDGI